MQEWDLGNLKLMCVLVKGEVRVAFWQQKKDIKEEEEIL